MQVSEMEIGKAFKAYSAYNFKEKKDRLKEFNLKRWVKVIRSLGETKVTKGKQPQPAKRWSPARRAKFQKTISERANGHG